MTSPLPRPARAPNTPPASFGEDAVTWAMWLYYAEGRTQNEVAQTLGVSRASVANYLSEARRRGLVSINMQPDVLAGVELGRRLSERYGLAGAHVVPVGEGEEEDAAELRRRLGAAGGHVLRPRLRANQNPTPTPIATSVSGHRRLQANERSDPISHRPMMTAATTASTMRRSEPI